MSPKKLDQKLKAIVNKLKPYNPEKIILFGSYVKGEVKEGSDVDLLIIKRTKKLPHQRIDEVLKLLYPPKWYQEKGIPLDVLVYTPKEVEDEAKLGDFFLEEILTKGEVIYEKTHH